MTDPNDPNRSDVPPPPPAAPAAPAYGSAPAYDSSAPSSGAPASQKTNVLAIVSLVSSFLIPLVGIITGHIALSQIKKTGEQGRGLAVAGLIIGYVLFVVGIIVAIAYFALIAAAVNSGSVSGY
ncbi:DUF4190 domain-containing protein [Agromyces arachidis]|uniref:DUF4190 domain-containing protein n=1 Tax=Agromyces arachidis TaxID=766966 RepID=UPI0040579706